MMRKMIDDDRDDDDRDRSIVIIIYDRSRDTNAMVPRTHALRT